MSSLYGSQLRSLFGVDRRTHVQLGFDFASLEARIQGHYCKAYPELGGDELAVSLLAEKPMDLHSLNAQKLGISRDNAKSISYGLLYGAQEAKISKMLNISKEKATKLYNDYWDAVPSLKYLKEVVEKFWKATGNKFVKALDGRLLTSRSGHSLLNFLLQSGGSLVTKYTNLYIAKLLDEQDALGDVLVDDEEAYKRKVYQLIVYHDELQYAMPKYWYKPIFFESEEEASACRVEQKLSTPVHYSEKRQRHYLDGQNKLNEIISKAIKLAEEELNLRVEIGYEYSVGLNWADTH